MKHHSWEQRKLGDVVDVCSGRDYKHLEEGDIPVYGTGGYMLSVSEALSEEDDAIGIGRKGTIDNPYILRAPFWTVDTLFYCVPKNGYDLDFVYGIYQNINWKLMDESTGVPSLSKTAINKVEVSAPSLEEQKKIGGYFTEIDNLITLHQRKYDKLKNIKKSMLEKMFPKNGEKKPEIRFAGFTDDWEQRKFASVFDGLQNNTLSRAELNYESGTVKNVHYGDVLIKVGDYIDASETELPYISDDAKADKFKNSFLQDGDIIFADTAEDDTVGKCTEIQGSEGLKLLSGLHTIACRPKEKYGPMFLGYYINSPAYHNQLKPLMQGIKVTSISKSALQDTNMTMPKSVDEQTMIGEYFSNLDNLITLHQRKLEKLKNIKKSMLEKMFV